jgi:uncharacterized membrane protein
MTELQPTEIELSSRKKGAKHRSKRKIAAVVFLVIMCILIVILTAVLAHRASKTPQMVQPTAVPAEEVLSAPQE